MWKTNNQYIGVKMSRVLSVVTSVLICFIVIVADVSAGEVMRREIEPGVLALGKDGRTLGLEVRLPQGSGAERILSKYLVEPKTWKTYEGRLNSFVPFDGLKPEYKRKVLLTVYPNDVIDERGWTHTATFKGETLWSLSHWATGSGANHKYVQSVNGNKISGTLLRGQMIRIPLRYLTPIMKQPTPKPFIEPTPELVSLTDELTYKNDRGGRVAVYRLKRGENLYSSVVQRFTDYAENADVVKACEEVARLSGIRDVRDIDAGSEILIPIGMLSDQYQPAGSQARVAFDETLKEAERLKRATVAKRDLNGVVVILDPGHGGKDHGAAHSGSHLYEDEINYDITMRIVELLRSETDAKVYLTMKDRSSGEGISDRHRFTHDADEELLTNPPHPNNVNSKVSANLRWMLANNIYDRERKAGVPSQNIVFTSVHTDSIFNASHRGAMIYIPGAQHRRAEEKRRDSVYSKYAEGRTHNTFASTASERRTDEALSRNFANVVLDELGKHRIKRYTGGSAIRSKIQKTRTYAFVPAVLRNTKVPTKILIETANLQNSTDRQRLADPWWRQEFAKAYVAALKRHYKADGGTTVALAD